MEGLVNPMGLDWYRTPIPLILKLPLNHIPAKVPSNFLKSVCI